MRELLSFTAQLLSCAGNGLSSTSPFDLGSSSSHTQGLSFALTIPTRGSLSPQNTDLKRNADCDNKSAEAALGSLQVAELPQLDDYVCLLHKVKNTKHHGVAGKMRRHACGIGFDTISVLEGYSMSLFAKCGSISHMEQIFRKIPCHTENTWACLMQGYIETGEPQLALELHQVMQREVGISNKLTLVFAMKACVRLKWLDAGQEIHAEIVKEGFDADIFVGSMLVDMYVKCYALVEAQDVFDELMNHDVVLWTTLISGYSELGFGDGAFRYLEQMKSESVLPDSFTYICILKACGSLNAIQTGQQVHAVLTQQGYEHDIVVASALVDMYSKCGFLSKAQEVFDELPAPDVVTWTSLLMGYTEAGLGTEALDCFENMQMNGLVPDPITYACTLNACGSIKAIEEGLHMHSQVTQKGYERDGIAGDMLVEMYAKCGHFPEAWNAFGNLAVRDTSSWNGLMTGYAEHEKIQECWYCLEQMQSNGVAPNNTSYLNCLKGCNSKTDKGRVQELHTSIVKCGYDSDTYLGSILVTAMSRCGSVMESRDVFNALPAQTLVSWNALIAGYSDIGLVYEAMSCLKEMQLAGFSPGPVTYICCLKACGIVGAITSGQLMHSNILKMGYEQEVGCSTSLGLYTNIMLATTLIDMYSKCGGMPDAKHVFDSMPNRDEVIWNSLITAYALQAESPFIFLILNEMAEDGCVANDVTFLAAFTACNHGGLLEEGCKYFWDMKEKYGISPTLKIYTCMIDLFGRAGQLGEAVAMFDWMPFEPDLTAWSTVLGACHKYGERDLGMHLFGDAGGLFDSHSSTFVLMSNMFAYGLDEELSS